MKLFFLAAPHRLLSDQGIWNRNASTCLSLSTRLTAEFNLQSCSPIDWRNRFFNNSREMDGWEKEHAGLVSAIIYLCRGLKCSADILILVQAVGGPKMVAMRAHFTVQKCPGQWGKRGRPESSSRNHLACKVKKMSFGVIDRTLLLVEVNFKLRFNFWSETRGKSFPIDDWNRVSGRKKVQLLLEKYHAWPPRIDTAIPFYLKWPFQWTSSFNNNFCNAGPHCCIIKWWV